MIYKNHSIWISNDECNKIKELYQNGMGLSESFKEVMIEQSITQLSFIDHNNVLELWRNDRVPGGIRNENGWFRELLCMVETFLILDSYR